MSRKRRRGLTVDVVHVAKGVADRHTYRCDGVSSSQLIEKADGTFGANIRFVGGDTAWVSYAQVEYIVAKRRKK